MQMPLCDQCKAAVACVQDLGHFAEITGNKRVPPLEFCKAAHEAAGLEMGDFYSNAFIQAVENPTTLFPVFPELKPVMEAAAKEELNEHGQSQLDFMLKNSMPLNFTLLLTEKCNLQCDYCYERFLGNVEAKSMNKDIVYQAVHSLLTPENVSSDGSVSWDMIGGEVFVEFELLKYSVDTVIERARELGIPPCKVTISLCTNGTHFHREEVRAWLMELKTRVGFLGVGISLDGIKACHDLCRNNSFDRVMEHFDWWRAEFPDSGIKGTISPATLAYLFENVKFYVEELKLDKFYINPTFEGPWSEADVKLYAEELIKCAEYFLERQYYNVLENSNLFASVQMQMAAGPRKQNWCGSGVHMRAVCPEGIIYPCVRGVTSKIKPLGDIWQGVDAQKLLQFYLYTRYNEDTECAACDVAQYCPSCVMQWVEDTGDMFFRSKSLCAMTKARIAVSQWYFANTYKELQKQAEAELKTGIEQARPENWPESRDFRPEGKQEVGFGQGQLTQENWQEPRDFRQMQGQGGQYGNRLG